MRYDYFGNTSLRVSQLLYNFETQLLIFDELFSTADKNDVWRNDSELQMRYLELLKTHNLLDNKSQTKLLGTKDARVKSAPLEDFNLIKRKEKRITKQGYELLHLIKTQAHKINNDFLQIDLISLFFLKATLNFSNKNLLQNYLEVFKAFSGELNIETFAILPLINNFKNPQNFIQAIKNNTVFSTLENNENLDAFLYDLEKNTLRVDYFKTAKGDETAISIVKVLEKLFLALRKKWNEKSIENFLSSQCDSEFKKFKTLYLPYIIKTKKKEEKQKELRDFICTGNLKEFGERFYNSIIRSRLNANLKDYCDLNRRYLNLTGIFEFEKDKVALNLVFKIILNHSHSSEILEKIATSQTSKELLKEYFDDKEFKAVFKKYGILNKNDLKNYKENADREKLKKLIDEHFTRNNIIEILKLFEDRKNDSQIVKKINSKEATIPTIFEYIIAIAWHYIDDENLDRILNAGLSLDSNLLPKSHAVGGDADFKFYYEDHALMIEVTLTEKTNQRRAEMESVSRHLGNLLLSLEQTKQQKSFSIFIAPYLDKNVLNDFRSRIYCYFEKESEHIKGMKILPLNTNDIIKILESKRSYQSLKPHFEKLFASQNDWGSQWYNDEIVPFINSLKQQ